MQLGHFSGAPTLKMGNTWDQGLIYCLQACNLFITRLQAAARRSLANIFTPSKYFYVTLLLLTCEDPVHVRAPLGGLLLPPVLVGGCPGGGGGDLEAVLYQALVTSSCAEVARSSSHTDLARDARQLPPRQPRLHGHQHAAAALKMTLQQLDGADERHSLACDNIVRCLIFNAR